VQHDFDRVIIGAGVVGLAIAAQAAQPGSSVCLIERHDSFGRETSSRNSEVIHAGLYYPNGSLKACLCAEGRERLYRMCERESIAHRRVTKLVVAVNSEEVSRLERLMENACRNGAGALEILSKREVNRIEPHIQAEAALFSPETGIVDSHALMVHLERRARTQGVVTAYRTHVTGIEPLRSGYRLSLDEHGQPSTIVARQVINSAGLGAEEIARRAGIETESAGYRLHFCKGEYFSLHPVPARLVGRLIYPLPPGKGEGLGVNVTLDLQGRVRLGPNARYVETLDYSVDPRQRDIFYASAVRMLPFQTRRPDSGHGRYPPQVAAGRRRTTRF
jgi:L-2-hydroxyglutarate oxidase LhgO